jgi:cytochrome P450
VGRKSLTLDPFGDTFLADPYAYHGVLRGAGALVWFPKYSLYGMARHAQVSAALRDWQTFCSGRGVGLSDFAVEAPWRAPSLLLETDPPVHDQMRKLMNAIVSLPALNELRPIWRRAAERLVEALVARQRIDAITDLAEVYPLSVFPDTIGLRQEGRSNLLSYAAAVFNAFGPRNAIFDETEKAAASATAWVLDACKRQNLADGGWGMAVYRAADDGKCTEAEAGRLVRSFLSAGVDTTISGLAHLLHAFASFPAEWQKLREDPSLKKRAVEEALRWDSPVQTFFRTTTRPVEIEDAVIPEGSKVLLFLGAANRDPDRWDRPEIFDISRQASGHVAFGFGIHQCLGQMVARLEAEMILEALLPRVAAIRLAGPVTRRLNNTLRAIASLPVELVPA